MGEPLALEVLGLRKRFGPLRVLEGVDLRVGRRELVALVGENGTGKSTVVKCVARALEPDAGVVRVDGEPTAGSLSDVQDCGVQVVWQDLALCDNLDVVANLFLGRERSRMLWDAEMHDEARRLLDRFEIELDELSRPVGTLSGGQRQSVALARAMLGRPRLLILDEPTAALDVTGGRVVERLIQRLRARGTAILLIAHDLDLVCRLADRVLVLREGRITAAVSPREYTPDDLVALMSGIEADSTARRQLRRLHSLVDQLSDVEPSASLPLIVSALAAALDQDHLCVHLLVADDGDDQPVLRRSAAVGLDEALLGPLSELAFGPGGGVVGLAAEREHVVVADDIRTDPGWEPLRDAALASGILSSWTVPILGRAGLLGTITGFAPATGRPQAEQLELASLYAGHAAGAIERERLLAEMTQRNRVLETLRGMLETLAGPEAVHGGMRVALLALCRGVGAQGVTLWIERDGALTCLERIDVVPAPTAATTIEDAARAGVGAQGAARHFDGAAHIVTAALELPAGNGAVVVRWSPLTHVGDDVLELIDDATRSLQLASEREELDDARQEADALRRSHSLQRDLLLRLSHELRTPLTAIHGYASTLSQPDVAWDDDSQGRFLDRITSESGRLGRLVGDLLDASAIESGILRLHLDWCDLPLVIDAAVGCVPVQSPTSVEVSCEPDLPVVHADHDRLEQVLVNLVDNAVRHNAPGTNVLVEARCGLLDGTVEIRVSDDGDGLPAPILKRLFEPGTRGATQVRGSGLGLTIARGIVEAHSGQLAVEPVAEGASFLISLLVDPPGVEQIDLDATLETPAPSG